MPGEGVTTVQTGPDQAGAWSLAWETDQGQHTASLVRGTWDPGGYTVEVRAGEGEAVLYSLSREAPLRLLLGADGSVQDSPR